MGSPFWPLFGPEGIGMGYDMARRLFTLWLVKIQDQSNISETTDWCVSAICSRAVQFWSTSTLTTDEGHLWG
jgi:hypothetical protein